MPAPDRLRQRSYDGDMMFAGRDGESAVLDFLRQSATVSHIEDLRDDLHWRDLDVDFRVQRPWGAELVEAKSDVHLGRSPYVLFEALRINHTSREHPVTLGWSARSAADWFLIWSPEVGGLYFFRVGDFRTAMRKHSMTARKAMRVSIVETDRIKTTINFLIPLAQVPHRIYERVDGCWRAKYGS